MTRADDGSSICGVHRTLSSTRRAFVVQFRDGATLANGCAGRVEHVRTGDAVHFETLNELLRFIEHGLVTDREHAHGLVCPEEPS
jgi:hypothetical protein